MFISNFPFVLPTGPSIVIFGSVLRTTTLRITAEYFDRRFKIVEPDILELPNYEYSRRF